MRLFYVADPMCSWCWGFASTLAAIEPRLPDDVRVELVLGGLAPDSDAPMDESTRRYVQRAWRAVEARTGAPFDHSFWERCSPRRSTWPACRAVLAAGARGREMFGAIQRAYYTEARDPSDVATLVQLAGELGLDREAFRATLDAPETHDRLREHLTLRDELGVQGFPALILEADGRREPLAQGWVERSRLEVELQERGVLSDPRPPEH